MVPNIIQSRIFSSECKFQCVIGNYRCLLWRQELLFFLHNKNKHYLQLEQCVNGTVGLVKNLCNATDSQKWYVCQFEINFIMLVT